MIFNINFASIIPKDKSNMSYEEFYNKAIFKLKYQGFEQTKEFEGLLKPLYEMDIEKYNKLYKSASKIPYTIIKEYPNIVEDLISNDEIDSGEVLKEFTAIFKKAGSIVNRVFERNYVEFMSNDYSIESYNSLASFVDNIVEDDSEVLERVYSEFDDYIYEMKFSKLLIELSDIIRKQFPKKIVIRGKKEIDKYNRLIERKNNSADIQALKTHMILEKRRKNARYN